ncbi:hypothetical protein BABINDRAFT_162110 [Babjeviella inositovora NRRL Y-12698]|uniref:Altered inheritance of mitochondria protein 11 n=1 Tax=Babjeviella inositovora NRRL Y-12698 TaxID=984486 RepID=A0A1E3QN28_9ASCO|nr:uncharacterized protein BABINDRAFT_162110 [Babjeviella inositovora NRRL Y-12698]ODQ79040.1 hypothetical protein BABINDRAFT_162110 [Babjeviella inositovora NRRL Y-12698]
MPSASAQGASFLPSNFGLAINTSAEYKERRRQQMLRFVGATVVTFVCARVAYRGVLSRKYVPTFLQPNHLPPPFSFHKDALLAITHSTLLACSAYTMAVMGGCWCWDVSSFQEFSWRMKKLLGGAEKEQEIAMQPVDEETRAIQDTMNNLLSGKFVDSEEN